MTQIPETSAPERDALARLPREALVERVLRAERRAEALVEVGRLFAAPRPLSEILRDVARHNVEALGDLSLVHVVDERGPGGLLTTAVEARDPAIAEAIREHLARRPIRFDERVAGRVVYETGRGLLLTEVTEKDLRSFTRPDDAPLLAMLGLRSAIVVPLRGRAGVVGTMDVVSLDPACRYGPHDYDLAQEIADRAAAAVETARLVERLERDLARMQELERARDEFLSVAAHDLRTPLAPLVAVAELVARHVEQEAPLPPHLPAALLRQVARLEHLIGQFLDVSRAREGRLEVETHEFDLAAAIRALVATERLAAAPASLHEIFYRGPERAVRIVGDERRIEQVVANLLDNAQKYSPEGGPIEVALTVHEDEGEVEVSVCDPGIGIPEEDLPHVFERFRRARNAVGQGRAPGLGLGLYIAREIVRLHGGRMMAESREGEGTRVAFRLPLGRGGERAATGGPR